MKNKILKLINSCRWKKLGEWKEPLLFAYIFMIGHQEKFFKRVNFGEIPAFKNYVYVDGLVMLGKDDWRKQKRYFLMKLDGKERLIKKYIKRGYNKSDNLLTISEQIKNIPEITSLSSKKLAVHFSKYITAVEEIMPFLNSLLVINEIIGEKLRDRLVKSLPRCKKQMDIGDYLRIFSTPKRELAVVREGRNLLKIAAEIQRKPSLKRYILQNSISNLLKNLPALNKTVYKKLIKHREQFAWLNSTFWIADPFTLQYYLKRSKILLKEDPSVQLKRQLREKQILRKKSLRSKKYLNQSTLNFIKVVQELAHFRAYRFETLGIGGYKVRDFMNEIARRLRISYKDIIYLFPEEIIRSLNEGQKFDIKIPQQRQKGYALVEIDNKIELYLGKDLLSLKDFFKKIIKIQKKELEVDIIKGTVAYKGIAKGKVRIVPDVSVIKKMEKNEILVTLMTTPDYAEAIAKAKAIITDEGGLLCHAAIIAREFNIPCIIGTKIATKVLKDGDLVEVDANKGIVKIIK